MFELLKKSLKIKTKLGFAVTLLVLTSACAHETIPPQQQLNATERAVEPTPEPYAKASPVSKPVRKVLARHGHKKYVTIAKHKAKHVASKTVAKIEPQAVPAAPAAIVLPPPPPKALTMASISAEQPQAESVWQKILGSWITWFAVAYGIGLAAIASRKFRAKKGKGGKLVFNN